MFIIIRPEYEYNSINIDNCINIYEIDMFLVHIRYGCYFILVCNVGNYYLLIDKIFKHIMHTVQ